MKGRNYFLDSNVFLRVIVRDEVKKASECEALLQAIIAHKINAFTSHIVLSEIAWVSRGVYKFSKQEIVDVLRGIATMKNLKNRDTFNALLALEYFENYGIKFIDALIASDPSFSRGEFVIVSYDKDFDKLGLTRVEPGDISS